MNRTYFLFAFLLLFFVISFKTVNANSTYVLPYPSSMPGNILYNFSLLKESILNLWYFGDLGQFTYNLKESDKYLVEAKTLFEYDQYLLALKALRKSDNFFRKVPNFLDSAKKGNKNIVSYRNLLKQAALKHDEVLRKTKEELPESVNWKPEKEKPEVLMLHKELDVSISLREKYL